MFFIYNLILPVLALLCSPIIVFAFIVQPKFRAGFWEKFGFYKFNKNNKDTIVFHAVSVGEVNAIEALVKRFRQECPDKNILLTTTTKTGQDVANKRLGDVVDVVTYFPYDFIFSVNAFLSTFNPSKIIIAETEIWPCFVSSAKNKGIKVYVVNGRISPNSYNGYKKFKLFFKPILSKYEQILMQSDSDRDRIIDIGADSSLVKTMGNLKFDITPNLTQEEIDHLKNEMQVANSKLIVAASTHSGEDEIILKSFLELKKEDNSIKLLIAPRHPERYNDVENLIKATGLSYGMRSKKDTFLSNEIIMLDTMGELSKIFSISYLAFIGGSFSETGGHNPLEANIWGKPVISGPSTFNFKDIYKILIEKNAAVVVQNNEEFTEIIKKYLLDFSFYLASCEAAKCVFEENKGAIDFVINNIL